MDKITMYINDLMLSLLTVNSIKYAAPISMRQIIQDDLNELEQRLQIIRPDYELVRLSPSDEALNGYAFLPPDEVFCANISLHDLLKPPEHGLF